MTEREFFRRVRDREREGEVVMPVKPKLALKRLIPQNQPKEGE